ncbi:hypothetical protein H6P81_001679 [Aristolochia fimbriata]|uniref:Uncharacterized protein n=1 Tax=Aristolochia fimbriata TaxID=158543 RepID=A0AAV7FBF2_ARIFI|nr:hypothetical protein H6P81_001679 [Aristolochia fimbriata]
MNATELYDEYEQNTGPLRIHKLESNEKYEKKHRVRTRSRSSWYLDTRNDHTPGKDLNLPRRAMSVRPPSALPVRACLFGPGRFKSSKRRTSRSEIQVLKEKKGVKVSLKLRAESQLRPAMMPEGRTRFDGESSQRALDGLHFLRKPEEAPCESDRALRTKAPTDSRHESPNLGFDYLGVKRNGVRAVVPYRHLHTAGFKLSACSSISK